MALKVFTNSGGDFSWATAGNWNPSGVPASNDTVVFIKDYPFPVTGGLNQGGIDLDLLWVQRRYTANIGSSGTPLQIASDKVLYEGDGDFYYHCDLQGGSALKTDLVVVKAGSLSKIVELGSVSGDAGEIDKIVLLRGRVQFSGTLTGVDRLEVGSVGGNQGNVQLTINDNAATIPVVIADSGTILDARVPVTDLHLSGNAVWTHKARAVANLFAKGEPRFVYDTNSTITLAKLFDRATLDASQTFNSAAGTVPIKTITELLRLGNNTRFLRPADVNLVTVTTTVDMRDEQ